MTFRVLEITLFYLFKVRNDVKIALSIFFSRSTLSKGSITVVYGTNNSLLCYLLLTVAIET